MTVKRERANELDAKTWLKYSISIWSDVRKSSEERRLRHPAMFPLQLAARLIECFTNSNEKVVLDPFAGSGTTIVAAQLAGKVGVGFDTSEEFTTVARNRLAQKPLWGMADEDSVVHCADANDLLEFVQPESVDLVVTSPPYWDILTLKRGITKAPIRHYGDAPEDLGKIADYDDFIKALRHVFELVFEVLKSGKYCVVVVMDLRKGPNFYPLHSDVADFMREIGFIYDDIVVWDRRHEYHGMCSLGYPYVFRVNKSHEFILIFKKPAP